MHLEDGLTSILHEPRRCQSAKEEIDPVPRPLFVHLHGNVFKQVSICKVLMESQGNQQGLEVCREGAAHKSQGSEEPSLSLVPFRAFRFEIGSEC